MAREFALDEMPRRINYPSKGSGFDILRFRDHDYLISYSDISEPQLVGRIVNKVIKTQRKYIISYVKECDLHPQERTDIKNTLSRFWS